jgi:hypothetical protein
MTAWVTAEFLLAEAGGSGTVFDVGANPLQIVTDIGNDWGSGYNAGVMVGDVVFTLTKPGTGNSGHTIAKTDGTVLMPEAGLGFDMAPGRSTNSGSGYTDFIMTVSESGSDYVFEYTLGPSHNPDGTPVHADPLYTNTISIAKTDVGPLDEFGFHSFAGNYNAQFGPIHIVHTFTPTTFAITEIEYDPDAVDGPTVTLTWRNSGAKFYAAFYSLDMTTDSWGADLNDSIAADEGDTTTETFDLPESLWAEGAVFFRIEER